MNKFIYYVIILVCLNVYADDKIALEILNKVNTNTKSFTNINIDFDFIIENNDANIYETQKGNLFLEGKKYQLKLENQTIINNGDIQWIYLSDFNEVQIMNHFEDQNSINPEKIFTIYKEDYKKKYVGKIYEKKSTLHLIDLFPKESSSFIKINLTVNDEKEQIEKIIVFDKDGGKYSYIITSFTTDNSDLKPFIFNVADYPGAEVIDLR